MKLLTTTALALSLLAPASAQTNQAGVASGPDAPPTMTMQDTTMQNPQMITITRSGAQPSRKGPAENFTGSVRVDPLLQANDQSRMTGASVTFEPGARTAWHTHPLGQILIVTAGVGRVQHWGDPVEEILPGDVVRIPPGVKHWHGAAPAAAMTHIALVEQLDGKSSDWMEKVSDQQYNAPVQAQQPASAAPDAQPKPSQRSIGDFSPKLAELTDDVLYGDVWKRPQLSKRDRSLATVAALIALNRPDQLRSHFARASANGVTQEELIETITHLAFYAGWPNAITAIAVAREVFEKK
jgi:4-carboxymuconolactone decarboxylase